MLITSSKRSSLKEIVALKITINDYRNPEIDEEEYEWALCEYFMHKCTQCPLYLNDACANPSIEERINLCTERLNKLLDGGESC